MTRRTFIGLSLIFFLGTSIMFQIDIGPNRLVSAQGDDLGETSYPWTMFRCNLNNSGYSESRVPQSNYTFFNFSIGSGIEILSSPIYHDFKIYFGSGTWTESSVPRKLYDLEVATGAEVWNYTAGGAFMATPLIVNDTLFAGSLDGKMYALNATTGEHLWNFSTGNGIA